VVAFSAGGRGGFHGRMAGGQSDSSPSGSAGGRIQIVTVGPDDAIRDKNLCIIQATGIIVI